MRKLTVREELSLEGLLSDKISQNQRVISDTDEEEEEVTDYLRQQNRRYRDIAEKLNLTLA